MSMGGVPKGNPSRMSSGSIEDLAQSILHLDHGILDCNISSDPEGSVLANVAKPSIRGSVESYSRTGSGMGPTWGLTVINILRRLDKERSRLNYVMVSREKFNAIFFPTARGDQNLLIGVLLEKNVDTDKIFNAVASLVTR